jgi:hypothetical protein
MERKRIKSISDQIETERARLQYALAQANDRLAYQALTNALRFYSMLYEQIKETSMTKVKREPSYLVFSDEHADGIRLTLTQYRALTRSMSKSDLATHVAVPIDDGMEDAVEQAIMLDKEDERKNRAG